MNKTHKRGIVIVLIIIGVIIYYVRTVPQVSLTERAIVFGLGIDIEDDGYLVTMEIINPKSQGAENTEDDGYILSNGSGDTLSDAIYAISHKTGLTVSLSQCNILILGESILNEKAFPALTYLIESYGIPEQAILMVSSGSAKSLLETKPLLTGISAMQISNAMHTSLDGLSVLTKTLKDFFVDILSKSGTSTLAYVDKKEVSDADVSDSEGDKYFEYDYSKCVLFNKNGGKLFDDNVTKAYNYVNTTLKKGDECIVVDGVSFDLSLDSKKYKESLSYEDGRIKYQGELTGKFYCVEAEDIEKYFELSDISDEQLERIENKLNEVISNRIINVFLECRAQNYDIYGIADKAYSYIGKEVEDILDEDNYLDLIDIKINSSISVGKK